MRGLAAFGLLLVVANVLITRELDVCVDNQADLDEMTMQAFRGELSAIMAASGRPGGFTACREGGIKITLRSEPPAAEPTALGATRYKDGRLLPEVELYVGGIAQLVETRLPGSLGRAMARVATHELGHYLYQDGGHCARGPMMERLSAAHLLAADRSFFRLSPPPGN